MLCVSILINLVVEVVRLIMSNIIEMFYASSNEIIKKYSTFLTEYYMNCRKDISWEISAL